MHTDQPLRGRVAVVTGGSGGLGRATALELARRGARVVIIARSHERCAAAVAAIAQATGNAHVSAIVADLSLMNETRRAAAELAARVERLDVLVNNAGAIFAERQLTGEGLERTFALNHLSPFVLTNELLGLLRASAPARVITVSSNAHRLVGLPLADLPSPHRYLGVLAYARSKLANVLFTYELARRLAGSGITANALAPGMVSTNIGRDPRAGRLRRATRWLFGLLGTTPARGARTSVHLAVAPGLTGVSGTYWSSGRRVRSAPLSYDQQLQAALWRLSVVLAA